MNATLATFSKTSVPPSWPAPATWPAPAAAKAASPRREVLTAGWAKPGRPPSAAVLAIRNYLSSPPVSPDGPTLLRG